jgi:hypothetical protein
MPRAVPSQIVHYLSANLEQRAYTTADLNAKVGVIAGFHYAALVAGIATIELAMDRYRSGKAYDELAPIGGALPAVWNLIKKLPDSAPTTRYDLPFITDAALREMIRTDIRAIGLDLQSGEWKGATVLAGSCNEALLLYGIQELERRGSGAISSAVNALPWGKRKLLMPPIRRTLHGICSPTRLLHVK